jgi:hypothetical protein
MMLPPLDEAQLEEICKGARDNPISPNPATANAGNSAEEDYLFTVWYRLARHMGHDDPHPHHKTESESDVQSLRRQITELVAANDSEHRTSLPLSRILASDCPKD